MEFELSYENKDITRLDLLKILLEKSINGMTAAQKFQIVTFNTHAKYIKGDENTMFTANSEGKKEAIELIKTLQVGEGEDELTNISGGLDLAYNINHKFERINMLTDGGPTVGVRDKDGMIAFIKNIIQKRVSKGFKKIPVNTKLLMLGGEENEKFRALARSFTKLISIKTGGIVKNYDSKYFTYNK